MSRMGTRSGAATNGEAERDPLAGKDTTLEVSQAQRTTMHAYIDARVWIAALLPRPDTATNADLTSSRLGSCMSACPGGSKCIAGCMQQALGQQVLHGSCSS